MTHMRTGLWLLVGSIFCLLAFWNILEPVAVYGTIPDPETPTPTATSTQAPGRTLYFPLVALPEPTPSPTVTPTPTATVARTFDAIPVAGGGLERPAAEHPDINLAVRGYTPVAAYLGLVNYGGDTDENAPQLAAMFAPARLPPITGAYQVFDWDWNCNRPVGCRGAPITWPYNVSLIALATTPGETISIPARAPDIYQGQYRAMVLYAEARRITLAYTRDDSAAVGYVVHLEAVAVAPQLVALYQALDAAGRRQLPALRNGEVLGVAAGDAIQVAVRDTGMFMDPRACKDWWTGYMGECRVRLPRPSGAEKTLN